MPVSLVRSFPPFFMSFVGARVPVTQSQTLLITLDSARVRTTVPYLD